ncbi:hypothetical protein OG729_03335 [Streptomyces sp. NBC_00210]
MSAPPASHTAARTTANADAIRPPGDVPVLSAQLDLARPQEETQQP